MSSLPDGITVGEDGVARCWWGSETPEYVTYHDDKWGRPVGDDTRLFEKLTLEAFQSGLSWLTILRKREGFRRAFAGFDAERVARFDERDVERLLADASIVRHRGKIEAAISNARRALELREEEGSLASFAWGFEPGSSARPDRMTKEKLLRLTTSPEAVAMAKDLKRRGWRYLGPTTVYSFMQAMGLVNDHLEGCASRASVETGRRRFVRPAAKAR